MTSTDYGYEHYIFQLRLYEELAEEHDDFHVTELEALFLRESVADAKELASVGEHVSKHEARAWKRAAKIVLDRRRRFVG
jgi:hypothetical protein